MGENSVKEIKKILSKNEAVKIYKKILNGKLNRFPRNYWINNINRKYDAGLCVRYMLEVVLEIGKDRFKEITKNTFVYNGLGNMLKVVFDSNVYDAIDQAYKNEVYPWNLKSCSNGLWNKAVACIALRDVVRRKGWSDDDIVNGLSYEFIRENGLEYPMKMFYKNDIYSYVNEAFNGRFKRWQFNRVGNGYWTDENVKEAVLWMIDKYNWDRNDIKKKMTRKAFKDVGLDGMLVSACNGSPYQAIEKAMPGEFKQFEFRVPRDYWNRDRCIEAIIYMIEKVLKYSSDEVKSSLKRKNFIDNKLLYAIRKEFDGDIYEALNAAYDGIYKRSDLSSIEMREKRINEIEQYMKYIIDTI